MIDNRFPLYIVTKGRYEYMITSKALTKMGLRHNLIVEPQEVEKYKLAVKKFELAANVIELDMSYKEKYEKCDKLGMTKSTGSGAARNYAWDHSIKNGYEWHWVMDDNINEFYRLNKNLRVRYYKDNFFKIMEDFVLKYKNVVMAGPNYVSFAVPSKSLKVFTLNTRIYSCNFIRNNLNYRWRGRYNEDTILSLDLLKAGYCTFLFNCLLQNKMATQTLKGGNTEELYDGHKKNKDEKYSKTGTMEKSMMLKRVHPDVTKLVMKYGRHHHHINYNVFKQKPIKI